MALSTRKRFQQRQIQPVKTRSSHDVTSGIAVLSGVAHRVESLESGYVEPALHSSRTVVRIGDKVGPVGGKSLDDAELGNGVDGRLQSKSGINVVDVSSAVDQEVVRLGRRPFIE